MTTTVSANFIDNNTDGSPNVPSQLFSPVVLLISFPNFLTNTSSVFDIDSIFASIDPPFIVNSNVVGTPSIHPTSISVTPDFVTNSSSVFSIVRTILANIPLVVNTSSVFNAGVAYTHILSPLKVLNASVVPKPISYLAGVFSPVEPPIVPKRSAGVVPRSESFTTDVNKVYKDFSIMFRPHPLTGDITRVFDYDSITQSLKIILLTSSYERPFSSQEIAGNLRKAIFSLAGEPDLIRDQIVLAILAHDRRVIVQDVTVNEFPADNAIEISITYKVKTFEGSATFSVFLERA